MSTDKRTLTLTTRGYIVFVGLAAIFGWFAMYVTLIALGATGNSASFWTVLPTIVVVWVSSIIVHTLGEVKGWWTS